MDQQLELLQPVFGKGMLQNLKKHLILQQTDYKMLFERGIYKNAPDFESI
jgi:hypothetical protein